MEDCFSDWKRATNAGSFVMNLNDLGEYVGGMITKFVDYHKSGGVVYSGEGCVSLHQDLYQLGENGQKNGKWNLTCTYMK